LKQATDRLQSPVGARIYEAVLKPLDIEGPMNSPLPPLPAGQPGYPQNPESIGYSEVGRTTGLSLLAG
jgi:hypothetical protein